MKSARRLNLALIVIALAGLSLFLSYWAVMWLMRGSHLTAAVFACIAIWSFGTSFHLATVIAGAPRPREQFSGDGTVLTTPKSSNVVFLSSFVAGVFGAALYLVFKPFGLVDYAPTGVLRVGIPAFCGFLVVFGLHSLFRTFKLGGESYLRLGSDGFEAWSGHWGSFASGDWDDVEEILDQSPRGRKIRRELIVFVFSKGRSAMFVADTLTTNGQALREWVRFYWQRPGYRTELTDGRALRRLEEENFTVG